METSQLGDKVSIQARANLSRSTEALWSVWPHRPIHFDDCDDLIILRNKFPELEPPVHIDFAEALTSFEKYTLGRQNCVFID